MQAGQVDQLEAWARARQPLRDFMFAQIEYAGNEPDLYMVLNYRGVDTSQPGAAQAGGRGHVDADTGVHPE